MAICSDPEKKFKILYLLIVSLIFCFCACGDHDAERKDQDSLSSANLKYLRIVKDNGNVPPGEDRYEDYRYTRAELSDEALERVDEMVPASDNLYCAEDGVTYEVIITDINDDIVAYVSNNRDCGRDGEDLFLSLYDIEALLALL